jgi:hypothetical protein
LIGLAVAVPQFCKRHDESGDAITLDACVRVTPMLIAFTDVVAANIVNHEDFAVRYRPTGNSRRQGN